MKRQPIITRSDLLCKKDFAEKFNISRVKLDQLIRDGMIPGEVISNVFYCSIADQKSVDAALAYKNRSPQSWHRPQDTYKEKKRKWDSIDDQIDLAYEAFEAERAKGG